MALPILDGNQSATTLSTIIDSGQHIPAHTVVSLGSTAISNITSAVSGSVVSVSNFPSTQTIAGTVTASNLPVITDGEGDSITSGVPIAFYDGSYDIRKVVGDSQPLPVTINPTGTIPSISGTVTANVDASLLTQALDYYAVNYTESFPVLIQNDSVNISGTVTAVAPNGTLTTRFGSVTTANTAFASSAVTNANRKYLLIQNVTTGSNVITVGIGFTPTTTQGIQLTAGAGITFESSYIPTGAVQILSSVTASNFTILEA